jgi:hypothetical protein
LLTYNGKTNETKKEREKRKRKKKIESQIYQQREMVDKQVVNKAHLERKKKNSRFRNKRISVLVVLSLLLQHPVLVLIFKQ